MYALLAVLALQIAFGNVAADADSQGALRTVAGHPAGTALLAALALGFTAYVAWQVYLVWTADDWGERVQPVVRGLTWAVLAVSAVRLLAKAGTPDNAEQSLTARLLALPPGQILVGAIGVIVIVVGLSFLRHLRGHRYFDSLRPLPARTRGVVKAVTVSGITAKAAVYVLTGAFLIRAAVRSKARGGVGLDGALSTVAREPYGTYLLAAVAGGFAAYAVWCWVRARYENIEQSDG